MITPAQCRAARALVEISREDLATLSTVAHRTIVDFERGARDPRSSTKEALRKALEGAGVIFLDDGQQVAGGPGVRLPASGEAIDGGDAEEAEALRREQSVMARVRERAK